MTEAYEQQLSEARVCECSEHHAAKSFKDAPKKKLAELLEVLEDSVDIMNKYELILFWSDEDDVYVVDIPELPGCKAHGDTQSQALQNAQDAIKLWIDTSKEFGDPIPEPKGRRLVFA
ncbi:MAG: type II toxin-antitoxin system HicB family antitoxin [Nitrospirales bacterium]